MRAESRLVRRDLPQMLEGRSIPIKISVEVWLAAAALHEAGRPEFSGHALAAEVEKLFGDTRPGIITHIVAHCVANATLNTGTAYNYLSRPHSGTYRLWRPGDHLHPTRIGGRTHPHEVDIPPAYISLYRKWALESTRRPSGSLPALEGGPPPPRALRVQRREADTVSIHRAIRAYYDAAVGEHHRYRSWDHCYGYFREARRTGLAASRDHAALQLAFYLASWGMYRGSSFLLQHAYTVHRSGIDLVAETRFDELRDTDLGASETDFRLIPQVDELIAGIRQAYRPFALDAASGQATDTLVTKVILGTFGCLPACDRYFVEGFKGKGFSYSYLNNSFLERVLGFCEENMPELLEEQASIKESSGVFYPLIKLVDMYFWQIGYEKATKSTSGPLPIAVDGD